MTQQDRTGWLGPVFTLGFAAAIATWVAAFFTHLPGLDLPGRASGPIIVFVWFVTAVMMARSLPRSRVWTVGPLAGLLTGAIGLLLLGSQVVEQPALGETPKPGAEGLKPESWLIAVGFILLGLVVGTLGTTIGARLKPDADKRPDWLAMFSKVTVVAFVPLLGVGGHVTSTDAGMAVPDWPNSFGANMFLYPVSLMADPGTFIEHSHRLFGTLVGVTTIALLIATFAARAGLKQRIWAVLLLLFVIVQGLAGGFRVTEDMAMLRVVHGIFGQIVFAVAVALAVMLTPTYRAEQTLEPDAKLKKAKTWAVAGAHVLLLQLILGAVYRHLKYEGATGASHVLWTHIGFSIIVLLIALVAGFRATSASDNAGVYGRGMLLSGRTLGVLVGVQWLIGWLALFGVMMALSNSPEDPRPQGLGAIATTAHQLNGAFVLASASAVMVWTRRAWGTTRS